MIESIDNILQIVLTAGCTIYAVFRAVASGKREWILFSLFCGVFFLGDIHYILKLVLYPDTYEDFFTPYICWYTSYLFLLLLLLYLINQKRRKRPPAWMYLLPVFTAGMCIFFMVKGDEISNLFTFVLMTMVIWNAASGLRILKQSGMMQDPKKWIYILTLVFCLLEYLLWTISFFWIGDKIYNPYFWVDTMISACFVLMTLAVRKAVDR